MESAFFASIMKPNPLPSRRDLFKAGGLALAATAIANTVLGDHHKAKSPATVKIAPPNHWAGDGVHPSQYGAALTANFWLKAGSV